MRIADGLATALAFSLPLSTSATGILAGLWLVSFIPVLDRDALRRVVATPAGYLPVLLWLFGLVGMLWAEGLPLKERLDGLGSFHKLLVIPLLMAHFSHSRRGDWVLYGFLAGCGIVLAMSWTLVLLPGLHWGGRYQVWVPVKDHIAQSAEFTICIFLLMPMAMDRWREHRRGFAVALSLLGLLFLANILFLATRTALVAIPVLLLLFAARYLSWKASIGILLVALAVAVPSWWISPNVRQALPGLWDELRTFQPEGERTRAGERLVFWIKSIDFIRGAPVIGHGTGSIREQFRRSTEGKTGMAALAAANPHQQTLAVAIQLGLAGAAMLWAMWVAHLLMFRDLGMAAWAGLVVVAQNIVGSLFNSHLFDFTHGWIYVVGVGVAAGVTLQAASPRDARPPVAEDRR